MKPLASHYWVQLLALASMLGCAQTPAPPAPPTPEPATLAQVGYGAAARYVLCPLTVCGAATRKTIADPPAPVLASAPVATASAAAPLVAPAAPEAVSLETYSVTVVFPPGSAKLSAQAKQQLDRLAPLLHGAREIAIRGRTDATGDAVSNERLAVSRARAVYDHLRQEFNTDVGLFRISAQGACCFVNRNDSQHGRASNRRTEVDIVYPIPQRVVRPS